MKIPPRDIKLYSGPVLVYFRLSQDKKAGTSAVIREGGSRALEISKKDRRQNRCDMSDSYKQMFIKYFHRLNWAILLFFVLYIGQYCLLNGLTPCLRYAGAIAG